jgi:hypothetical protein
MSTSADEARIDVCGLLSARLRKLRNKRFKLNANVKPT